MFLCYDFVQYSTADVVWFCLLWTIEGLTTAGLFPNIQMIVSAGFLPNLCDGDCEAVEGMY